MEACDWRRNAARDIGRADKRKALVIRCIHSAFGIGFCDNSMCDPLLFASTTVRGSEGTYAVVQSCEGWCPGADVICKYESLPYTACARGCLYVFLGNASQGPMPIHSRQPAHQEMCASGIVERSERSASPLHESPLLGDG